MSSVPILEREVPAARPFLFPHAGSASTHLEGHRWAQRRIGERTEAHLVEVLDQLHVLAARLRPDQRMVSRTQSQFTERLAPCSQFAVYTHEDRHGASKRSTQPPRTCCL